MIRSGLLQEKTFRKIVSRITIVFASLHLLVDDPSFAKSSSTVHGVLVVSRPPHPLDSKWRKEIQMLILAALPLPLSKEEVLVRTEE